MQLSDKFIYQLCDRFAWDYASEYGEPGYGSFWLDQRAVILGDYWLRGNDKRDADKLEHFESRWPRIWRSLEESGVSFEWYDEWVIDYERSKAYRTTPNSYSWTASVVFDDHGELLTPDDNIELWIDWARNNPERALFSRLHSDADLKAAGFILLEAGYEAGWHPGQDDNPKQITEHIHNTYGDNVDIVFMIDNVGQFDCLFSAYIKFDTNLTDYTKGTA